MLLAVRRGVPGSALFWLAAWHIGEATASVALCAYPLLVVSTLLHPESVPGRMLEWAPVRWVGRISYSIYLWQMPFFPFFYPVATSHSHLLVLLSQTWLRYPTVLGLSLMSYYWIEKPFIRIGNQLAKSAVPGRGETSASR